MRLFDYIIVCKSPDFKNVDRVSQLMLLITLMALSYALYAGLYPSPALLIAIMTSVASWWIFCVYQKIKGGAPYYRLGLVFASWGWFLLPNALLIAGVYLIAALVALLIAMGTVGSLAIKAARSNPVDSLHNE